MASKNPKDSIKRTGELLLSGWKLLNTMCPICNTALLSKQNNLRCPMCDLPIVTEANQASFGKADTLPTPPEVIKKKFEIEDDYYQYAAQDKVQHQSLEEAKKEYDLRNKRMNSVSGKLGEKMMAGWTLLGIVCPSESCQGTPLMRHGTGPMSCVACDTEYKESSLGDLVPMNSSTTQKVVENNKNTTISTAHTITTPIASITTTTTNPPLPPSSTTTDTSSFYLDMQNAPVLNMDKFALHTNDASAKISKRLMQGWALLDKCCWNAQCKGEVPLMRDLAGKEICVECSALVGDNKTNNMIQASTITTNIPHKRNITESYSRTTAPTTTKSHSSNNKNRTECEVSDVDYSDSEEDAELFHRYRAERNKAATATADATHKEDKPMFMPSTTVAAVVANTSGDGVDVALQVLQQKLSTTAMELNNCKNITQSLQLTELIIKLGTAIHTMQNLK